MDSKKRKLPFSFRNRKKRVWVPIIVQTFGFIKEVIDPEFPFFLFSLKVLSLEKIILIHLCPSQFFKILTFFLPTSSFCNFTPIIGLSIENICFHKFYNYCLRRSTPLNWIGVVSMDIPDFSHSKGEEIVKQLNDKERISAAFENMELRRTILGCFLKKRSF